MSKIIFFSYPFWGHINVILGLLEELVKNGDEILFYSSKEINNNLKIKGIKFYPYPDYDKWNPEIEALKLINYRKNIKTINDVFKRFRENMAFSETIIKQLNKEVINHNADLIFHDYDAVWGGILSNLLNIPKVTYFVTFAFCDKIFNIAPKFLSTDVLGLSDEYYENNERKIKRVLNLIGKFGNDISNPNNLKIVFTSRLFQPYQEAFESHFKFVGPSYSHRNNKSDFPFHKLGNNKIVYIAIGSILSTSKYCINFFNKCIKAFEKTNYQVILSIGKLDKSKLLKIPDNFIIKGFVPQLEILKYADVFISHGGMNSVTESIFYNVPLIIFPFYVDQFVVARRIEELETGIYYEYSDINEIKPNELLKKVEKILSDDKYYENCKKIKESLGAGDGHKRAFDEYLLFKQNHKLK